MPKIGYDISHIENIFSRMIDSDTFPTKSILNDLRKELNAFFSEAVCVDVGYTRNTDNLFFGMQVVPMFDANTTLDIVLGDKPIKINRYCLELDSKLFSIGLEKRELTAILLHEVGHIVTNDLPVKQVRMGIDAYFANKDQIINLKNSAQYTQLLTFAIKDMMRKANSFIFMNNDEVKADAFVAMCGYGDDLASALGKLSASAWGLSKSTKEPKLTILAWVVNLYSNVKLNRIPAINSLRKAKSATGSALTKKEIDDVIKALNRIDTDVVHEGAMLLNEAKKRGLAGAIKANGFKAMSEDYFEYKIRIKNIKDEDDMIYCMRQINSRLTLIQDTLEEEMDEREHDRWYDLFEKYLELREILANHKIPRRQYGLWFDYDSLDADQRAQGMYA